MDFLTLIQPRTHKCAQRENRCGRLGEGHSRIVRLFFLQRVFWLCTFIPNVWLSLSSAWRAVIKAGTFYFLFRLGTWQYKLKLSSNRNWAQNLQIKLSFPCHHTFDRVQYSMGAFWRLNILWETMSAKVTLCINAASFDKINRHVPKSVHSIGDSTSESLKSAIGRDFFWFGSTHSHFCDGV